MQTKRTTKKIIVFYLLGLYFGLCAGYAHANESNILVSSISVEASADSGVVAKEKAIQDGQRKAVISVIESHHDDSKGGQSISSMMDKLSKLSNDQISDMISDFEIQREKISQKTYKGTLTYRVKASAFKKVFGLDHHTPSSHAEHHKTLLLPLLEWEGKIYLWEDHNLWRAVWDEINAKTPHTHLVVPLGDLEDLRTLDSGTLSKTTHQNIAPLLGRYQTNGGLVVLKCVIKSEEKTSTDQLPKSAQSLEVSVYRSLPIHAPETTIIVDSTDHTQHHQDPPHPMDLRRLMNVATKNVLGYLSTHNISNAAPVTLPQTEKPNKVILEFAHKNDYFKLSAALEDLKKDYVIEDFMLQSLSHEIAVVGIQVLGTVDMLRSKCQEKGVFLSLEGIDWLLRADPKFKPSRFNPANPKFQKAAARSDSTLDTDKTPAQQGQMGLVNQPPQMAPNGSSIDQFQNMIQSALSGGTYRSLGGRGAAVD